MSTVPSSCWSSSATEASQGSSSVASSSTNKEPSCKSPAAPFKVKASTLMTSVVVSVTPVMDDYASAMELIVPSEESEGFVKYFATSSGSIQDLTKDCILLRADVIKLLSKKILCTMMVSSLQITKSQ